MQPLTPTILKSARMLLKWTQNDLAESSSVSLATIKRFEAADDDVVINKSTLKLLLQSLSNNNVTILSSPQKTIITINHEHL